MDLLKLIPQLFFDLICRVVPGCVAIIVLSAATDTKLGKLATDFWDGAQAIQESALFLGLGFWVGVYLIELFNQDHKDKEETMNTSRLIWGIICLALAGLLAVLNFVLPPEKLMFMVGDANAPYLPPLILGILGVVLLATATRRGEEKPAQAEAVQDPEKADLNKRLETMAWGLFLIMLGGFFFVPRTLIAEGIWSIGVGVIMLGLNVARYFNQIKMSGFTTFLGVISVLGGVLQLFGLQTIEGAVLLIVLGAYLILKPWFDRRQLFGKAEEG